MPPLNELPRLGSGLGYRREIHADIYENREHIEWLEVITEHYLNGSVQTRSRLLELREQFRIVPHGIEMSIGSPGEVDDSYLDALSRLVRDIDAPYFSDHLCFTRTGDVALGNLTPLPRSAEVARWIAAKAQRVQERVGVPFVLENITYYADLDAGMSEAEFIAEFCEHCDCGLLLDLTNLYINSVNHGFDTREFLDTIPVDRIVQVHLAGGEVHADTVIDTHSTPVPEPVWSLFDELLSGIPLKASLIERDQDFPDDFSELLGEVRRAATAMSTAVRV